MHSSPYSFHGNPTTPTKHLMRESVNTAGRAFRSGEFGAWANNTQVINMATVAYAFTSVMQVGAAAVYGKPSASGTITSSGTSAQSTGVSSAGGEVAVVTPKDGDVWVIVGNNPTAVAGTDYLVKSGTTVHIGVAASGHKVAVIDA